MTFSSAGITFRSDDGEHDFSWTWTDIQALDRKSETRFTVLSYQDQAWLAGRDRPYDFTVTGGDGLSDQVFRLIAGHLETPVVDRIPSAIDEVLYEVPVKHLHLLGGCEGILRFGREKIVYDSREPGHSRSWRKGHEIAGVWSSGRYDLDLVVRERGSGGSGRKKEYRFQLKEALDEDFYFRLQRELLP